MRRWLRVVWGLMVLAMAAGCSSPTSPSGQVTYRVTGSATRVDLTYTNASGGTSQLSAASVPWTYAWSTAKTDDFVYVSAQITSPSGSITVVVERNGAVLQSATASGFASTATASGRY